MISIIPAHPKQAPDYWRSQTITIGDETFDHWHYSSRQAAQRRLGSLVVVKTWAIIEAERQADFETKKVLFEDQDGGRFALTKVVSSVEASDAAQSPAYKLSFQLRIKSRSGVTSEQICVHQVGKDD